MLVFIVRFIVFVFMGFVLFGVGEVTKLPREAALGRSVQVNPRSLAVPPRDLAQQECEGWVSLAG